MNINSIPAFDVAKSIEQMSEMLKNATSQAMDLENRLLKATVTEKVSQAGLGENIDVSA